MFQKPATGSLESLLDKYENEGVFSIEEGSVLNVVSLSQMGSPVELVRAFGETPTSKRHCANSNSKSINRPDTRMENQPIIIYNTPDGKTRVALLARDGSVWMNQNQLAELFDTSKQNIGQHIANILEEKELEENSVVKYFFTTAADGKQYEVAFYALDMILAIGFRVRSKRGTQFRIWANQHLRYYEPVAGFSQ